MLVSSFVGLAYEGISSFLHRAFRAMDSKTTIKHNKLIQLENSMLMYGIYNAGTLEKLIDTMHNIHNTNILAWETICRTAKFTDTQITLCKFTNSAR